MSPTLFHYINKRIILGMVFLAFVLVGCVWLTQSLRFVDIIVNRNVTLVDYFSLILLLVPDIFAIILPVCLLIAIIFTYTKISQDHELVIMRSFGLSNFQLAKPVFIVSLFTAFIILGINVFVLPMSFKLFRDKEYQMRHELSTILIQPGQFSTLRGVTIYIRNIDHNKTLNGIFIYDNRKNQHPLTIIAEKGQLVPYEDTYLIVLKKGTRQELKAHHFSSLQFDQLSYDLSTLSPQTKERVVKPYEREFIDLFFPHDQDRLDPHLINRLKAEGHQRLLSSLLGFVCPLLGVFFILKSGESRGSRRYISSLLAFGSCTLVYIISLILINISPTYPYSIVLCYSLHLLIIALCLGCLNVSFRKNRVS